MSRQDEMQSQHAGIPLTCDNKRHNLTIVVRASPDQVFHRGPARVGGYILLLHSESGATVSENIVETVKLRKGRQRAAEASCLFCLAGRVSVEALASSRVPRGYLNGAVRPVVGRVYRLDADGVRYAGPRGHPPRAAVEV
jgi:hypothetical protein